MINKITYLNFQKMKNQQIVCFKDMKKKNKIRINNKVKINHFNQKNPKNLNNKLMKMSFKLKKLQHFNNNNLLKVK